MSNPKVIAAAKRTKQFNALIDSGLQFVSTDRQIANGTLAFTGKVKAGRKTIRPSYKITSNGAVLSNEFVARRVDGNIAGSIDGYRQGLLAVQELLSKRIAA